MLFPETKRVVYDNNVLEQVICQLRFPTILRIDTEVPSTFQERIRHKFPMYQESREGSGLEIPESISQFVPRDLLEGIPLRGNLRYQFLSSDRTWTVTLTREFVALVTTDYRCWEDFRDNMDLVIQALIEVYAPAFITRIGLRYQNVIDRNALGVGETSWKDLIAGYILGPLAEEAVVGAIAEIRNTVRFTLNDELDFVRLEHGYLRKGNGEVTKHSYLLDNDLFAQQETQANADNLAAKLNYFNAANRGLFNWCITNALRDAMGPTNRNI